MRVLMSLFPGSVRCKLVSFIFADVESERLTMIPVVGVDPGDEFGIRPFCFPCLGFVFALE